MAKFTISSIKYVSLSRDKVSKDNLFFPFCTEAKDDSDMRIKNDICIYIVLISMLGGIKNIQYYYCLPNVARYGQEMSNVHQCHPRNVKRL